MATTLIRRHVTLRLQHHGRTSLLAGKLHAVLQAIKKRRRTQPEPRRLPAVHRRLTSPSRGECQVIATMLQFLEALKGEVPNMPQDSQAARGR